MPQGRPPKRSSVSCDSPSDSPPGSKVKVPRLDRGPEEFSNVVKSKLQSYTRTGQACDRCKVRKIRCDALPGGCSHCNSQSLECLVTDRVTGRTDRRGYVEELERDKKSMLNHIRELERLLEDNGIEVLPWQLPGYSTPYPPSVAFDDMGHPVQDLSSKGQWQQVGSLWVKNCEPKSASSSSTYTRYSLLESRPTDSYLGVCSDSEPLSSFKGTTLSILGTTIDITSFDAPDMDEPPPGTPIGSPLYNKSVMAFLQSALNVNPPLGNVELPSRQDAFQYVEWYFLMVQPFLPVLHKPSFLQLLTRIYDDPSYKASVAELVIVHMVFATIFFQYGIRNREEPEKYAQLNEHSNKHYHWCLSKFFDLAISQTVTAVQALAMITSHTRNFPKPGCSSMITHYAVMKAIELNLHRAVKVPGGGTNLENEIRKRVWWAILGIMVTLNGRLGRPMPITLEEFDVEFPMAVPDEYLGEDGILDSSKVGHCNYMVGLMGFRVVPLYMEMYSNIYSVRRDPKKYVEVVCALEVGIRNILDNLPDELRYETCEPSSQIFALYTQAFCLEFTLCLRHPSVCMTDDPKFCADNTRICEETAGKLLKVVGELLKKKSVDTTWYQLSVYVAAIFSTLAAHWERRFDVSSYEISTLRDNMGLWLRIIAEIGQLLGTGNRLANDVGAIIERTIGWIEHDMQQKDGTPPQQGRIKQQSASPFLPAPIAPKHATTGTPPPPPPPPPPNPINAGDHRTSTTNGNGYYDSVVGGPTTPYPALNYGEQAVGGPVTHQNGNGMSAGGSYDTTDSGQYIYPTNPAVTAAPAPGGANTVEHVTPTPNPLIAFASQATQHVTGQPGDDWRPQAQLMAQNAGNTWHDWTAAIADSQDRYSANALLTLGSGRPGDVGAGGLVDQVNQTDTMAVAGVTSSHAGQWPLLLFHDGSGTVSGA